MLRFNCTLLAVLLYFFRSRYVRLVTLLSISQARKWFPSLRSLKSKSPVISTWLCKNHALPGVFFDFSGAWRELPPPRYGRRLVASPRVIKLLLRTCRSNSVLVFFHFTHAQTFPEKVLVVSNYAMLKGFVKRKKQSFLTFDCMWPCRIVNRSVDAEVLTAKDQLPHRRSLQMSIAEHVVRFRSTPNCSHKQLARLTSFSFVRVGNESRF